MNLAQSENKQTHISMFHPLWSTFLEFSLYNITLGWLLTEISFLLDMPIVPGKGQDLTQSRA